MYCLINKSDLLHGHIVSQRLIPVAFRNIERRALVLYVTVVEHPTDQSQDFHQAGGSQLLEHHGGDSHPVKFDGHCTDQTGVSHRTHGAFVHQGVLSPRGV